MAVVIIYSSTLRVTESREMPEVTGVMAKVSELPTAATCWQRMVASERTVITGSNSSPHYV